MLVRKMSLGEIPERVNFFGRQDLVGEALVRLGYSSDLIPSARGSIVIRNWKPLPMEKVADGPLLTVGDILAELTSVATLKIQVYRSRPPPPSPAAEVRNKLLRLLLLHSHTLLVSAGCPLDEVWLSRSLTSESRGFRHDKCRLAIRGETWMPDFQADPFSATTMKLRALHLDRDSAGRERGSLARGREINI